MSTQKIQRNNPINNDNAKIAEPAIQSYHPTPGMGGMYTAMPEQPKVIQEGRTMKIIKENNVGGKIL